MPDYILWSSFIALPVSISSTVITVYLQLAHSILALKSGLVTQLASHWQVRVIDISLLTCLYTLEAFGRWSSSLGIFGRHLACAPICGAISVSETVTDLTLRENSTRRIQITFVLAGNMYLHLLPSKAFAACVAFWGAHGDPNSMRGCCLEEHGQRVRSSSPYPVGDISFNLFRHFWAYVEREQLAFFSWIPFMQTFLWSHTHVYIITIIIVIILFIIPLYKYTHICVYNTLLRAKKCMTVVSVKGIWWVERFTTVPDVAWQMTRCEKCSEIQWNAVEFCIHWIFTEQSLPPNTKRPPNTKNRRPSPISENFRLANLFFNWSPLENNLKINLPFMGFPP